MLGFLRVFRYIAIILVALSVPLGVIIAATFLMFCDSGPVSRCFAMAGLVASIMVAQVASLVTAFILLKGQRRIRLSAALMILSVVPMPVAIVFFSLA